MTGWPNTSDLCCKTFYGRNEFHCVKYKARIEKSYYKHTKTRYIMEKLSKRFPP